MGGNYQLISVILGSVLEAALAAFMTMHYVFRSIVAVHSFRLKLCSVKNIEQCPRGCF